MRKDATSPTHDPDPPSFIITLANCTEARIISGTNKENLETAPILRAAARATARFAADDRAESLVKCHLSIKRAASEQQASIKRAASEQQASSKLAARISAHLLVRYRPVAVNIRLRDQVVDLFVRNVLAHLAEGTHDFFELEACD